MDFRAEVLREHSKAQVSKLVDYIGGSQNRFDALILVYLKGPYRITQRCAWVVSNAVEKHPELVTPHLKALLDFMKKPAVHDAVKRNTLRLLQHIEIPKKYYGPVAEICFDLLQTKKEPVAIKAFALTVLTKLVKHEPDLQRELRLIIEDQLHYASPAFTVRATRALKELDRT